MSKPTLYLLLGLPGSGKTTTAKEISRITGAVHLSSDSFRLSLFEKPAFTQAEHDALYKMLDYMCELLLKNGTSVAYDANLNRLMHRQEKYRLAHKAGAACALLWVKVPLATAKARRLSEASHHKLVPAHETPQNMFDRIAGIFEPPKDDEPYIELDGTKINTEYVQSHL